MSPVHDRSGESTHSEATQTSLRRSPYFRFHLTARLLERLKLHQQTRIIIIAITVGLISGFLNVGFRYGVELVSLALRRFWGGVAGINASALDELLAGGSVLISRFDAHYLLLPLLPITGAAIVYAVKRFVPDFEGGYGFPRFLVAVNLRGGLVQMRHTLLRAFTSAVTIGSGWSAGLEGPVAQLGGTAGSFVGRFIQASGTRMRLLVACGVSAAIAANFNAPIAGVLFAFEIVLLGNYELTSFGAIVISAGMGTVVSRAVFGDNPAFHPPVFTMTYTWELLLFALLGVVCGVFGGFFTRFFFWVGDLFKRVEGREASKLFVGALAVGLMSIAFPQVMGAGYNVIQASLTAAYPASFSLAVVFAKAVATAVTLGSGMVGGMFGPPLVMGTMLGAGFGAGLQQLFDLPIKVTPYAIMGMGGLLVAVTHAPLTGIFLIFELTGNHQTVIPAMFVTIGALVVSQRITRRSLDGEELHRMGVNLEEGRDVAVLSAITVRDIMQPSFSVVNRRTPFRELLKLFSRTQETYFPVVDDDGRLQGILSFQDLRSVIFEESLADLLVAGELCTNDVITVTPSDTLQAAMRRFNLKDITAIPVVDQNDPKKVLGMLQRKDVLDAYNREVLRREATRF